MRQAVPRNSKTFPWNQGLPTHKREGKWQRKICSQNGAMFTELQVKRNEEDIKEKKRIVESEVKLSP
jgi:hypothetical protein